MITVDRLHFQYAGAKTPAIKGLDFVVEKGEIFGFLGPSGAGKSTTQKILTGLLSGYTGSAQLLGRELRTWGQNLYEQVGVGFELPNHYLKLTGLENLNYFRSLYSGPTEDPRELLGLVGLEEDANTRVGAYSKGMRMRLNFIRALINRPALLFLDEPTSGLDPVNARLIKDLIGAQRQKGTTVFLTTHNMAVADELCDRVAFIIDGEIKLIDRPSALKLRYGRRQVAVEYGLNGHSANAEFALDGLGRNQQFLEVIQHEHIRTIHTQETTLESIFVQLTGRDLGAS